MKKVGAKASKVTKGKEKKDIFVCIDYPKDGEKMYAGHYAFRISASEGYTPEISWNGKKWMACRLSAGFWWNDCESVTKGTHTLKARIRKGKKLIKKAFRACTCQ